MFDYSGYREVKRDNESYGTCDHFSKLHLRLKLTLFKQPLKSNGILKKHLSILKKQLGILMKQLNILIK